jgi:hypothetical protein
MATNAESACAGFGWPLGSEPKLATTFNPAGAARRQAYNAVWRTDPVLGGVQLTVFVGPDKRIGRVFLPTYR